MDHITYDLISALGRFYQPATSLQEATDLKTTSELVDEFAGFSNLTKEVIHEAMKEAGYKIEYTGAGFAWLLKNKA